MKQYYRTTANIHLDAIYENVVEAKKCLKPGTGFMAIVKADGYGHGAIPVVETIDSLVDAYGVAILEEGIELRKAGYHKPILILGYTPKEQYDDMIRYHIDTAVFTLEMAEEISKHAMALGENAGIHIKLDTGMSRIGFLINDDSVRDVIAISKLPGITIDGCFSHFARMDESNKDKAMAQFEKFQGFVKKVEEAGVSLGMKHMSNSAGIMEAPEVHLDMVRDGICLYGLYPSEEVDKGNLKLQPAMEWKAYVSYVKTLPAGVEIGYGGTFTTTKETRVATIPVGYADGYPRALSNQGKVLIGGAQARILGRVCMDQFMVDVTDIPDVRQGDEVVLFGTSDGVIYPVEEIAKMAHSFNYEFVCAVGKRVPRVYDRAGKIIGTRDYYPVY